MFLDVLGAAGKFDALLIDGRVFCFAAAPPTGHCRTPSVVAGQRVDGALSVVGVYTNIASDVLSCFDVAPNHLAAVRRTPPTLLPSPVNWYHR